MFFGAVDDFFEFGQYRFTDCISRISFVAVGFVGHERKTVTVRVCFNLCFGNGKNGTRDAFTLPNGGKPFEGSPPRKAEQNGFGNIVEMVCRRYHVRFRLQNLGKTAVTEKPSLFFQPAPAVLRPFGNVRGKYVKRNIPSGADFAHKLNVIKGRFAADPVFAGHGSKRNMELFRALTERVQKANRIYAARNGDANSFSAIFFQ